jgi:uncharacterized protein
MQQAEIKIGKSTIHGTGLFTRRRIPKRMKLGELSGEKKRRKPAEEQQKHKRVIQLIELDDQWSLDCRTGNDFRFLNHSCQANCYLRVAHGRAEVYSLRAISAGSELTVDYGETMHQNGMGCRCGVPGCRGTI